jgi:hypothetical protein
MTVKYLDSKRISASTSDYTLGTNNGTIFANWDHVLYGGSAEFDGSNDNIKFGNNTDWNFLHNGGSWTVSFWIKPDNTSDRMVFNTNGTTNTNIGIQSILTSGNLRTRIGNGSGDWVTVTKSSFSVGTWYFVVITFDGTTLSVKSSTYGGSLSSATTGTASGSPSSANSLDEMTLGSASDSNTTYPFDGHMNVFMIWDRVLTSAEINTLYGGGTGSTSYSQSGLVLRTCLQITGESLQWFDNQVVKPTNVQDNSILVEKDTGKRFWRTPPTVTVDDDLSTDKGWVSNTGSWTYNATGDYIDFATITRSQTAQQIYIDVQDSDYLGSGTNLSDTKWVARFKVRTGTQSSSSGNVMIYFGFSNNLGDSGTTQQSATMKMNFNGQANENNMTLSVSRGNFETSSSPARVNSDVYANPTLPYSTDLYMEMTRNGDVFTLKAYSDEYVTQASSTSVASVTVTGISSLRYIKAFNDSEQNQSYTSSGARLYDMKIYNNISSLDSTWINGTPFYPYIDNFSTDKGWVTTNSTKYNYNSSGYIYFDAASTQQDARISFDLGADNILSNTAWVMRWKQNITTYAQGSEAQHLSFTIALSKDNVNASTNTAFIALGHASNSGVTYYKEGHNTSGSLSGVTGGTSLSEVPAANVRYVEMIRKNATQFSIRITANSDYSGGSFIDNQDCTGIADLRYVVLVNNNTQAAGSARWTGQFSELSIYNGVSSV